MRFAAYSTDWLNEPVIDEEKSAIEGKRIFLEGQRRMSFGGTYFTRLAMPSMELTKHGYDAFLCFKIEPAPDGHIRAMDTQGEWHDDCDMIVFQRWMGEGGDEMARRAIATGQLIVNDLDDTFWNLPRTNIALDTTDPIKNPTFNRDHYLKMLGASSAITVSTEFLRKEMGRLGVPVYLVRNAIDIERWRQRDPGRDGMIGWVGGVQWRAHDLQVLKPVLPDFLADYGLPWYHGGDSQVPGVAKAYEQVGIDPTVTRCTSQPLVNIGEYPKLWEPINLALVPLERCRFNQAKSYLKSLEASALGLPYIVSAGFLEQQILIDEGGAGRVAKNERPQSWREHLEDLLDPEVRRIEGKQNRAVAELHDIRDRWVDWDAVYSDLAA